MLILLNANQVIKFIGEDEWSINSGFLDISDLCNGFDRINDFCYVPRIFNKGALRLARLGSSNVAN